MTVEVEKPGHPVPEARDASRGTGRRVRSGRRIWTVRLTLLTLWVIILIPPMTAFRVWYQARLDQRPKSDAIIVLGAAQYNGVPSPTLEYRLGHALTLWKDGVAPVIVTVGGKQPTDTYTEAYAGRKWLMDNGVPQDKVIAVQEGQNTLGEVQAIEAQVFKPLGWQTAVIVTDPWHSLRAMTMADFNGISAATSPTRSGPTVQTRDGEWNYIVRETEGMLWYGTLGRFVGEQ